MTIDQRHRLLDLLKRYHPWDGADAAQARRLREFVEANENCFDRSNLTGHVTGSTWLVDASGKRVLLTHHKKLGKWLQLGGHADGNPDVLAVAMKEAREESGIEKIAPVSQQIFDLDIHPIPAHGTEPAHFHYDIRFALQAAGAGDFIVSEESRSLAWIEIEKIETLTEEESLLRMARKWRQLAF